MNKLLIYLINTFINLINCFILLNLAGIIIGSQKCYNLIYMDIISTDYSVSNLSYFLDMYTNAMQSSGDGTNSIRTIVSGRPIGNTQEVGQVNGIQYEESEHSSQSMEFDRMSDNHQHTTVLTASESNWRNSDDVVDIGTNTNIIRTTYNIDLDMSSPFTVEINITSFQLGDTVEDFPIQVNSFNSSDIYNVANGDEYYRQVFSIQDEFIQQQIIHEVNTNFDGHNMIVNLDLFIE